MYFVCTVYVIFFLHLLNIRCCFPSLTIWPSKKTQQNLSFLLHLPSLVIKSCIILRTSSWNSLVTRMEVMLCLHDLISRWLLFAWCCVLCLFCYVSKLHSQSCSLFHLPTSGFGILCYVVCCSLSSVWPELDYPSFPTSLLHLYYDIQSLNF